MALGERLSQLKKPAQAVAQQQLGDMAAGKATFSMDAQAGASAEVPLASVATGNKQWQRLGAIGERTHGSGTLQHAHGLWGNKDRAFSRDAASASLALSADVNGGLHVSNKFQKTVAPLGDAQLATDSAVFAGSHGAASLSANANSTSISGAIGVNGQLGLHAQSEVGLTAKPGAFRQALGLPQEYADVKPQFKASAVGSVGAAGRAGAAFNVPLVNASAPAAFNPSMQVHGEAFVGARGRVAASVEVGNTQAGVEVGPLVGVGAFASAGVGYDNGKLWAHANGGVAVGAGVQGGFNASVDVGEIARNADHLLMKNVPDVTGGSVQKADQQLAAMDALWGGGAPRKA